MIIGQRWDSSIPEALDHYLSNYADLLKRWDSVLAEKGVAKVEIDEAVINEFRAKAADPIRDKVDFGYGSTRAARTGVV